LKGLTTTWGRRETRVGDPKWLKGEWQRRWFYLGLAQNLELSQRRKRKRR
jgi:hypothetical protein